MNQKQQQGDDEKIRNWMFEDFKGTQDLQEKISDKIFDLVIRNTIYRRDYYTHITTLAVAILGFSVIMLNKNGILTGYLITGIILFLFLIVLLVSHLREILDEDQKGLDKQNEEYKELLETKKNIYIKYLSNSLTPNALQLCQKELRESPRMVEFSKAVQRFENQRKLRYQRLNYTGEFIILLFITGIFFVLFAILNHRLKWFELSLSLLILIIISFSDLSKFVVSFINKIVYFILELKKKSPKKLKLWK